MSVTAVMLLDALIKFGPTVISVGQKLVSDIAAGRGDKPLTADDWAELDRLANQSAEDIYKRLGITPPPKP
jgi:hypothetical protein